MFVEENITVSLHRTHSYGNRTWVHSVCGTKKKKEKKMNTNVIKQPTKHLSKIREGKGIIRFFLQKYRK